MGEWIKVAEPVAAKPAHEHEKPHLTGNETADSIWKCRCGARFQLMKPTEPVRTYWEELK